MKRLLLSLTAALALGAYADIGDYGGTGFESLTPGNALDIAKDDAGDDGAGFWEGKEGEEYGVISNHIESVEVAGLNGKNNYLKVEADSTLYRYAIDNAQPTRTIDVKGKAGIYFDSLVQFTGAEEIPVNDADRAKLAVWLYKSDSDDGVFGIGTNLIVTAGYLNSANSSTATNYVTTLNLTEGWHRLTVKMIPEIGNDTGVAGFVVFVDGVEVQNAEVKGDVGSVMDALNATAAKWADKNALFPSMISTGAKDAQTFECVGFKGQGALDELLVTENAPDFAADSTFFTLNWDAGLASLTIDEDPVEGFVEGEAGSTVITVTAAGSTYTVAAVAKDGYNLGARTVDESGNIVISGNDFVVNGTGVGNIVVNQTKFLVNGQPYSTLEDAIEAAGEGGTIKLNVDIEFDPDIEGDLIALDSDNFVFDLAGHTITLLSETNSPIEIDEFSTLKIIDSVGGGKLVGGDGGSIFSLGVLIIGDADGNNDKGVTFDGVVCIDGGECLIVRGNFDKQNDSVDLEGYKAKDTTITDGGDYWVATPNDEPPTPVEDDCLITFKDENEGSTFVNFTYEAYTNDTDKLTITDNKVTVKQGATVKVVQTPKEGYKYVLEVETDDCYVDEVGNLVVIDTIDEDEETLDWTLTEPTAIPPEPTTYAVSFYTNSVDAANLVAVTNIEKDAVLTAAEIPAIFAELEGTWDSNPVGAVITEATNFVFTIAAGKTYPTYIPDVAEIKEKFDIWVDEKNGGDRDVSSEDLDAFLLNCAPDQVDVEKAKFKITSIVKVDDEWVVKACDTIDGGKYLNGYVNIVPYDINGEADDPANAEFFQATLTIQPVNKE